MTASSTAAAARSLAPHLTDSIRRTADGAHRAAGLFRCHHFVRPLADSCSPYAVVAPSVLRVSCLLSFAPASLLDRTLAFFVLMWGRIQGGLCFPDKANRSGQMLRRGWATRNGCHWSKSVDRGSLLEQFYVVLMRKHPLVPRFIGCIYQLLRR